MAREDTTWELVVPGDVILGADGEREWEVASREGTKVNLASLRGSDVFTVDTTNPKLPPRVTRVATAAERRETAEVLLKVRLRAEVIGQEPAAGEDWRVPSFGDASDIGALLAHIYHFHLVHETKVGVQYPEGNLDDVLREHAAMHAKARSTIPQPHVHNLDLG